MTAVRGTWLLLQHTVVSRLMHALVASVRVLSFRGDNVNGIAPAEREPDPARLLQGYRCAASACRPQ